VLGVVQDGPKNVSACAVTSKTGIGAAVRCTSVAVCSHHPSLAGDCSWAHNPVLCCCGMSRTYRLKVLLP
jgi:hypothetical protein